MPLRRTGGKEGDLEGESKRNGEDGKRMDTRFHTLRPRAKR